jgi:hypothetical protein
VPSCREAVDCGFHCAAFDLRAHKIARLQFSQRRKMIFQS